ncbi:multidrug efflux RND transporter permease subunit [Azotosporobacter soli]|uniref:efflux RND transporter permease subunit n=1 Tax=Azotosporobacter soli TaxID=3055040 RepID=UPI0031FF1013
MANFFIKRPIFAIVLSIFIVIGGLIAAFTLPIAQYPQITPPNISVSTSYNGANAEVVEQSIAQLIEMQVNGVEDMVAMQSTSSDNGQYSMSVKFELGKDGDIASVQTQNRVSQASAQLPTEVMNNGVVTKKVSPDTILYFSLWSEKGTYDSVFMKNYGSINIVEDLKRIKGVGNVMEYGSDFGMRIWLQPDKMARLSITSNDISNAIKAQNLQAPAGTIGQQPSSPGQEFQMTAQVKGRLAEPAEFEKIMVRAQPDGSFVRLGDVARVEMAGKDYLYYSDVNGHESVTFGVQLTPDANALDTVNKVRASIDNAAKHFPADMQVKYVVDNTKFVKESLDEVVKTFAEALLLVLFIVFLFLQSWRATLIPMLAIPVSLVGTMGAFLLLGFSINTLTLFAMVLAIGLVVDDAIVVVEAVEHHMRHTGLNPRAATIRAMSEVSGPVVAIAFVLASVFIPVAFMGGTVGVLYKQFALTIAVSMALSAIVALSLTPALCTLILKAHDPNAHSGWLGRFFDRFNTWFDNMTEKYGGSVGGFIRRSKLSLLLLLVLVILTGALFQALPTTFVPDEDQGYYITTIALPEAANMDRTRAVANKVAAGIRAMPGVQDTIVITGYDIMVGAIKPNSAIIFTGLKPWSERTTADLGLANFIRSTFGAGFMTPEANVLAFNPPALPGVGSLGGFTLMLQDKGGGSIDELNTTTQQFLAEARKRPEIGMIYSTFRTDTPAYRFEVDREKAAKLGVPTSDVFGALQTFLGGSQVNDFNRFGRTYKVVMQADPSFRSDVDATRFFFVRSSNGAMVPLNTLVKPNEINGPTAIKRFNGFRSVQIGGSPAPGYSSGQALNALEEVAAQTLPSTFGYEWADQSREEKLSAKRAPIVFGFAILFVFLCLAALYESWSIPFAVLLSVPTGLFGSFLLCHINNWVLPPTAKLANSVYVQIGLVMLIGLAAKNAILIVEFAKVRVDKGMPIVDAAIEAAKLRLRPILMTSFAFILGCVPLAIATGAGAGARHSMGTAVVGGMLAATVLGIFLIPVLFVVVERFASKFSRKKKTTDAPVNRDEE